MLQYPKPKILQTKQGLNGIRDLGLFYKKNQDQRLLGYTNVGYLSDPHNGKS